jgi:hypothetical protein
MDNILNFLKLAKKLNFFYRRKSYVLAKTVLLGDVLGAFFTDPSGQPEFEAVNNVGAVSGLNFGQAR